MKSLSKRFFGRGPDRALLVAVCFAVDLRAAPPNCRRNNHLFRDAERRVEDSTVPPSVGPPSR